jgi:hypothetical protein
MLRICLEINAIWSDMFEINCNFLGKFEGTYAQAEDNIKSGYKKIMSI